MWNYVDIHSHVNFERFDQDRNELIQQLERENIATITIGTDYASSKQAIVLAQTYSNLYAAVGLHPIDTSNETFSVEHFKDLMQGSKVVAIGECGLDYSRLPADIQSEKVRQKHNFEAQIEFAVAHDLPLMIHCREAYPDCLELLKSKKQHYGEHLRGNFHFFTSPVEVARQCLDIGFTVSFTGPITYGTDYDEVVEFVPLERMMAETDAPFAAPVPFRGKRNEPLYVKEVVKKIAYIKKMDLEIVRKMLVNNAVELFLSKSLSSAG